MNYRTDVKKTLTREHPVVLQDEPLEPLLDQHLVLVAHVLDDTFDSGSEDPEWTVDAFHVLLGAAVTEDNKKWQSCQRRSDDNNSRWKEYAPLKPDVQRSPAPLPIPNLSPSRQLSALKHRLQEIHELPLGRNDLLADIGPDCRRCGRVLSGKLGRELKETGGSVCERLRSRRPRPRRRELRLLESELLEERRVRLAIGTGVFLVMGARRTDVRGKQSWREVQ